MTLTATGSAHRPTRRARGQVRQALHASIGVALAAFAALAGAITGNWNGSVADQRGTRSEVSYSFSNTGRPIFTVDSRGSVKQIELTHVGQTAQWLLPGSGWAKGEVLYLQVSADQVQAMVAIYSERMLFGGRMSQTKAQVTMLFKQAGDQLQVTIQEKDDSTQTGGDVSMTQGSASAIYTGLLRRAP